MKRAGMILLTVSLAAGNGLSIDAYVYDWANGTANLGPETQINSPTAQDGDHRFIIYQGTVNLNEGADIQTGGNDSHSCNYIGVDRGSPANLNINGGSFWCTKAGGGAGDLGIGINNNGVSSSLTLNTGSLRVDGRIRSGVYWNSLQATTSSGTLTLRGGEARVNQLVLGATTASTGSSTVNLDGGRLTVNELLFLPYNGQTFTWGNGTLVAGGEPLFNISDYTAINDKTRTMSVTGAPATFDTAGFNISLPPLTGIGRLRLTGGGTVGITESSLSYGLILDDVTLSFGASNPDTPAITLLDLEIAGPVTLYVFQPNTVDKFPVLSWTRSFYGSLAQISVRGGDPSFLVREGNTLYLSAEGDPALLRYADAAGGDDTPASADYTRLLFTESAGTVTVNGDGLTFSQEIADVSPVPQRVAAPVTLSTANSSIYVAAGGRLELSGGLNATAPIKEGEGTLVLAHAAMPGSIIPKEGILDFGGNTYTGTLNAGTRRFEGQEIVLTNGVWRPSGQTELTFRGSTITLADGFTADLTANANSRIAISWAGDGEDYSILTKLVIAGGTMLTAGNSSNVANFVGVDHHGISILEVRDGTFHATGPNGGYLRVAANNRPFMTGIVRVSGGLFKLDRELSMATAHNGLSAGTGKGIFELSGGVADIERFYLGATNSGAGRGEVYLTGGILEVGQFRCLPSCMQSVTADGATIRAKRDDSAEALFLAADEPNDTYAKSYTIGNGGLLIDTDGHNVGCTIPWKGEGGMAVTGGGTLRLDCEVELAGNMEVAEDTTLRFSCSQTFSGTLTLGADAWISLDLTDLRNDTMRIATGGFILPEGVSDVLERVELSDTVNYIAKTVDGGKTIEVSSSAGAPVTATWTNATGSNDLSDPANWICRNAAGGVVADALPGPTTTIYIDGVTAFTLPPDAAWNWAGILVGTSGAATLAADCDWSQIPKVILSDGALLDLNGHDLKVSHLVAAENGIAAVTNSVAGVRPALWRGNGATENDLVDTEHVTVYTDTLCLRLVTEGDYTTPQNSGIRIGVAQDAEYIQTNGTVSAATSSNTATLIGDNGFSGSYVLAGDGSATFGHIHLGTKTGQTGGSNGDLLVAENGRLKTLGWITVGHGGGSTASVTQDGGIVEIENDLNVGCYAGNTGTYVMNGGTLLVNSLLAPGRESGTGCFTMRGGTVTVNGSLVPGMGTSSVGTFVQEDGFVAANSFLTIGYLGADGTYLLTGGELSVTKQAVFVSQGDGSRGLFDIAGGVATAAKGVVVGFSSEGTLRIRDGGQLVTTSITNLTGLATVTFDGGKLKAMEDNPAFIGDITNMVFGAGGLTLDNAGYDLAFVGCTLKMSTENPAITMTGSGTLDLSDTTVELFDVPTGAFTVATATTGTFTGAPGFGLKGWTVRLSQDGKTIRIINPGFILLLH